MRPVRQTDALSARPYRLAWSREAERNRQEMFDRQVPARIGFATSGHTGASNTWIRDTAQVRAEVDLLRTILSTDSVDTVIAFAPAYHLYGFLLSFVLPMLEGIDVRFWPMTLQHPVRFEDVSRPLFVTVPSALARLNRQARGLASYESVTVVHSTAVLPAAGRSLMAKRFPDLRLVELFGSTETGLVATRVDSGSDAEPWDLAPDMEVVRPAIGEEAGLRVRGPRLAFDEGGVRLHEWDMDDSVRLLDDRRFVFEGRDSLLVKVNGRRVYLDRVEDLVRDVVPCQDLACVPARDRLRGEGFDLLIVPRPDRPLSVADARRLCRARLRDIGQPRMVSLVRQIPRTATGKLRLDALAGD
ncbi:xanthomonadin biosynthesis 3-hydroxybenozate--AMP ligase XanA2 [soil metagenome]